MVIVDRPALTVWGGPPTWSVRYFYHLTLAFAPFGPAPGASPVSLETFSPGTAVDDWVVVVVVASSLEAQPFRIKTNAENKIACSPKCFIGGKRNRDRPALKTPFAETRPAKPHRVSAV
jgi:hypothetical protein